MSLKEITLFMEGDISRDKELMRWWMITFVTLLDGRVSYKDAF